MWYKASSQEQVVQWDHTELEMSGHIRLMRWRVWERDSPLDIVLESNWSCILFYHSYLSRPFTNGLDVRLWMTLVQGTSVTKVTLLPGLCLISQVSHIFFFLRWEERERERERNTSGQLCVDICSNIPIWLVRSKLPHDFLFMMAFYDTNFVLSLYTPWNQRDLMRPQG